MVQIFFEKVSLKFWYTSRVRYSQHVNAVPFATGNLRKFKPEVLVRWKGNYTCEFILASLSSVIERGSGNVNYVLIINTFPFLTKKSTPCNN